MGSSRSSIGVARQTHAHTPFTTTSWTLIDAIRDKAHPQHEHALETLAGQYWAPVYASLRYQGHNRDEAAEITQAFFADVVLGRQLFEVADTGRGKLRTLLLTALQRYIVDRHRRAVARRQSLHLSMDDLRRQEDYLLQECNKAGSAEDVFERRWAMTILEQALIRCEGQLQAEGRAKHWEAFAAFVVRPSLSGSQPPALSSVADQTGFPSAAHVASALKVVRKRVQTLLREVAAETAVETEDRDQEYQRVIALLG